MNSESQPPEDDSKKSHELNREELALDDALQLWGAEKTAEPVHLVAQKSKAIELLKDETSLSPQLDRGEMAHESRFPLLGTSGWYWAIAATLLLAVGISWALSSSPNSQIVEMPGGIIDASALTLVSTNLDQHRMVLNRFHEVFGDDLESVAEFNGKVKVELRERPSETPRGVAGSEYVSVRLVVISRDTNSPSKAWDIVHDVSMLTEQELRVDIPMSNDGLEFSIWTYPVGDELVSVDLKIKFDSPFEIGQTTSLLQKIGEPNWLFTTTRNGTEYRLYQTINQIKPGGDPETSTQFEKDLTAISEWAVL